MNSSDLANNGDFVAQNLPKLRGNRPGLVAALFTMLLFIAGCSASPNNATPTPAFTPTAGTYTTAQYVTVSDTNQNSILYCTNDGSAPTASSPQCPNPITVSQSQTLKAIAIVPGMNPSPVATVAYTIATSATLPTVAGISVVNGPASGGTSVTITGTNFTGATEVDFGASPATGVTVNSATSITAISPAGTGTVQVTVVTSAGRSTTSTADLFAYDVVPAPIVTGIVSSSGPAAGGTSVTITGNNFTGATMVNFGTVAATSFTVNSATSITVVSPAGSGTVPVSVVTAGGPSANSASDQFTYISSPTVIGVSPSGGPAAGGTIVNISGSGFNGAVAVNFGAAAATSVIVNSATSITAVSPSGSGTVDVKVLTPDGESAINTADQFTFVVAPPAVTGISPSSGTAGGGTSVTITGSGFSGATAVNFGTVAATGVTVNSANSITAVSPAGSGPVDVTVVGPGGTSSTGAADLFTYVPPTLSGTVVSGPASGGTPINASVQLYAAGTSGYGNGPRTIGSPVQTDSTTGAFSGILYDCSTLTAPGDQLYLVAKGSMTGTVLMTALGSCTSIGSSFPTGVTVNEATTIASAYALSAFASVDSSGGIDIGTPTSGTSCNATSNWKSTGPSTCNYLGLKNAFAKVNNLVNIASGTALSMTPYYATNSGAGAGYNFSYAPQARVDSLANVLATCSNPNTASCSSLFTEATMGANAPADTLQAALNIAQNPGNNASQIASLVTASPFTPTISSMDATALTDWALTINYLGAGLVGVISPTGMAIDAAGNVWVTAQNGFITPAGDSGGVGGLVAVFNNQGVPVSPSATTTSTGGYSDSSQGGHSNGVSNPLSIAIDQNGYAWIGNYSTAAPSAPGNPGSVSVLDINGNPQYGTDTAPFTNPLLLTPNQFGIAVDSNNTVWVSSSYSSSCGTGIVGGSILALSGSASGGVTAGNAIDAFSGNSCPTFVSIDRNNNVWTFDANFNVGGSDPYANSLVVLNSDGSAAAGPYNYLNFFGDPNVAIGSDGAGWFFDGGALDGFTGYLSAITPAEISNNAADPAKSLYTVDYGSYFYNLGSAFVALDGANHAWTAISNEDSTEHNAYLFEANSSDTAFLSPLSSSGDDTPFGYDGWDASSGYPYPISLSTMLATDSSGNLWMSGGAAAGSYLTEFVGIAAPVPTPLVSGLVGNNLAQKP